MTGGIVFFLKKVQKKNSLFPSCPFPSLRNKNSQTELKGYMSINIRLNFIGIQIKIFSWILILREREKIVSFLGEKTK